jgi:hypothetical protein
MSSNSVETTHNYWDEFVALVGFSSNDVQGWSLEALNEELEARGWKGAKKGQVQSHWRALQQEKPFDLQAFREEIIEEIKKVQPSSDVQVLREEVEKLKRMQPSSDVQVLREEVEKLKTVKYKIVTKLALNKMARMSIYDRTSKGSSHPPPPPHHLSPPPHHFPSPQHLPPHHLPSHHLPSHHLPSM